jgi:fibronectin type 3 domain-containing protein
LTASAASSTQVDLTWGAATDNVGVVGYRVERCSGVDCTNFTEIAAPTGTSFSDTGLAASTSYSYRVRAADQAGNTGPFSNISSSTTQVAADTTPPSAPGTLTASAASSTQINLSWGAATDDVGVTGYRLERCAGAGCNDFAQFATPTGTTFSDTALMPATSYNYRVRAVDAASNAGPFSNSSSATTHVPPDLTPPSAPQSLTASAVSATQINLSWGAATDDVGVAGYRVERCSGAGCTSFAQIATPTGTTFNDTGLTASTPYSYRVRAVDAAGNVGGPSNNSSASTQAPPDTTPPSAPGTLTSTAISSTQIDLIWIAATDDVGVTGYRLERCSGDACANFTEVATPTGTTLSDVGLTPATSYSYRVRAVDAANNSGGFSNTSGATTQAAPDTTPPSAPGALTSSAFSSTQINLSWNAAADNVGVTGYQVERCAGANCTSFAQIATQSGTSFNDTGLTASTSYSYRVRAIDAAGNPSVFSNTTSSTTPDTTPPSAPGALTSSAISDTQIDLSWGAATDDVGVTGYRVERCRGASCTSFEQIATSISPSFSDTGRTASTSYSYRVLAVDAAGNPGPYSNISSATTPDTTPPSAPGTLTSSAASGTEINLSWSAAVDNVGVTGYLVERCSGADCTTFTQIATPTGTTYNDTGLTAATSYSYRIRAVDAATNLGAFSNISSATTQEPPDTTPPSAPGTLTASAASDTEIDLSWSAATDDVGVTGYRVERCSGGGCATFLQVATATGTTYNDTSLTAATSYSYRVRAVDAAGNPGPSSNVSSATTPDTTPPSPPGALTANAVSSTQINLAWGAATDNVGVTAYRVERCTGAGCTVFAEIAAPTGTSFNDTGLTASTSYSYRVRAVDAAGNAGGFSNTSSATTPDMSPPSVPGALTANAVSSSQINLSWGEATDDVGVAGYRVERCVGAGCTTFTQIATPTGTTYNDTGLTVSTTYIYRVRAVDAAGNAGPFSDGISATTPDTAPPSAPGTLTSSAGSSTQIDLSWGAATDDVGVAGYRVERCTGEGCTTFTEIATATGTTYADMGLTVSAFYRYRVRAVDAAGNPGPYSNVSSATTPDTTPPSAPGTLTSSAASDTGIDLSWSAATDNVGVTGYRVERCSGVGCSDFLQFATPIDTSYSDTGLTPSTSYSYRVHAVDAAGNAGAFSNTSSAATQAAPDTTAPSAPGTLTSSAVSSTQINLSWSAATDDVGVTGYRVERCSGAGCSSFTQIATPTGTSFDDTGLTASTSYSYRVRAQDAANNLGGYSNTAIAITQEQPDTTAPGAPGTLTASAFSATQINLSWGAATDDVAVTGYRVERCAGVGCSSFAQIATASGTSYSDAGRTAATSYSYRVRATDAAGNLGAFSNTASATTSAGGSSGTFQNEILISGMNLPTAVRFLPNGNMLILELGGKIWLVPAGTTAVRPTPFLSLANIGEDYQGLMDLTLDPDFENNHYYYVYYTLGSPNRNRVARFTVTDDHLGTVAGSEFVVYQDPQDAATEHHGGALNFGGDGKLYITTGENFSPASSQSLTSPRGKILRVNADGSVPTDNPFYDGAGPNRDDIWALGLRNPFRAFYDSVNGRLYVADVGGNDYSTAEEEVHLGEAGANFGWPDCEGSSCDGDPTYTSPIFSYPHLGRDASITGGFVYRGNQFPPEYYGNYFYADYTQNWIRRLTFDGGGNVTGDFAFEPPDGSPDGPYGDIVDLREGPDGALYYVDLGFSDTTGESGVSKIRRIRFIPGDMPPTAATAASPTESTTAPLTVNFSSAGSFDPEGEPLTYLWDFGDGATSSDANPTHIYSQLGAYTAHLTVSDGISSTTSAAVQITVGNEPVAAITSPSDSSLFRGGDSIAIAGAASDVEDGTLPASAFSWTVDFLHAGHVHPGLPTTGTKSLVFPIPSSGHDFTGETRYRITLTVTDSNGLKASRSVIIYPDKVDLTFDTVPSGLVIEIDGLPHTTPYVHDTLINFNHTIAAQDQTVNGTVNTFASWSDGDAQEHTIVVPAVNRAYTATYTVSTPQFPPGLVAGYRLSEGAGSTTADISGNNATGTLVGAPVWTTGRYGSALQFDGMSYVDLGNPVPLRLTGSMTLSAWINIGTNPDDDGAIVAKFGSRGWQLKTSADTGARRAAIQISSNGSDSIQRHSASVLTPGVWYHVAGAYDATARTLQIYVNGVLDNGALSGTVPAAQFDAPFNANIAQRTESPGTFNFIGRIDEVHVFNRALTAAEVEIDMNQPR